MTVYARLTRGGHTPVLNARVKATVFKPGAAGEVILDLNDNGAGYPDVTADDGIYSAYFSDFAATPGLYSIRVEADNNDGLARTPKVGAAFSSSSLKLWSGPPVKFKVLVLPPDIRLE